MYPVTQAFASRLVHQVSPLRGNLDPVEQGRDSGYGVDSAKLVRGQKLAMHNAVLQLPQKGIRLRFIVADESMPVALSVEREAPPYRIDVRDNVQVQLLRAT